MFTIISETSEAARVASNFRFKLGSAFSSVPHFDRAMFVLVCVGMFVLVWYK